LGECAANQIGTVTPLVILISMFAVSADSLNHSKNPLDRSQPNEFL